MSAMALTEHGNLSSHVKLEQAAVEAGIKPIFGCEVYTGGDPPTQKKNHLTVLASNVEGYRNLMKMMTWAWGEGFYYEPTVTGPTFAAYSDNLIVASGCTGGLLATSLIGGKNIDTADSSFERGLRVASQFRSLLGDRYYLEVQAFPELTESTCRINPMLARIGERLKIPLLATADVHYCTPDQSEMQVILHAVRPGSRRTFEEQERSWGYDVKLSHPVSDEAMLERLMGTGLSRQAALGAIAATEEVANRCNVTLPKAAPLRYPIPEGDDRRAYWVNQLREGWAYRNIGARPNAATYAARLKYEVEVIESKQYEDYFLIVGEMTRWAKEHGIFVGPARGSAAASLVCYLLRITEVDPVFFSELVFERFIDVTRTDMPDIDLDFDDQRRHEVFEHLREKYGVEQFNMLGTFTTYKSKSCLDDIGRVFQIPKWKVETVKELLIDRSSGDLRASATIEDTVEMFPEARTVAEEYPDLLKATRLEGMVKGMGRHAAGAIVASTPLNQTTSTYGETVAVDKYDAEYLNLIKIDVLGLNTCGLLAEAATLLSKPITYVYDIPLDDKKTLAAFKANDITGIFQFDGHAMRLVNGALKPDNFYELGVVNALARPGPLHNNAMTDYVDIKFGTKQPELRHPLFDRIVAHTQYQVVYQEQILRIVMEIGGFDWTHAAYIRRIISRKYGEQEFNRQWDRFRDGAVERGLSEELARKIWGMCVTAGAYAFCPTGDMVLLRGSRGSNGGGPITVQDLWKAYNSKTALGSKLRHGHNGKRITLQQMDEDGRVRPSQFRSIERSPARVPVFRVKLANGMTFKATASHVILTSGGYRKLDELLVGEEIVCLDSNYRYHAVSQGSGQRWHAHGGSMVGPGNPAWVDGRTGLLRDAKAAVLKRSKGCCEHCTKRGDGRKHTLEFAHILGLNDFNGDYARYHTSGNLLHLCNPCHKKFDYAKGERVPRDTLGKPTVTSAILSITSLKTPEWVYQIEMADNNHNFIGNGIVHHNNQAHSISYAMLGFWSMWLKVHHPQVFYTAALRRSASTGAGSIAEASGNTIARHLLLMRDAERHGLTVLPPDPRRSNVTWMPEGRANLRAGFITIPGIGEKTAQAIVESSAERWEDLIEVKGIGEKTIGRIMDWVSQEDPLEIHKMERMMTSVTAQLKSGRLSGRNGRPLPVPTHRTEDVPYGRGKDTSVVWMGICLNRNLRDLYEVNFARTGVPLDPDTVKDPHLREWVLLYGNDGEDTLTLRINRWRYPIFKRAVWAMELGKDLVLVKGIKRGFSPQKIVDVQELTVISP